MKVWWSMEKKNRTSFFLINMLIGFMLAIQFNTTKQANIVSNKTNDLWELRQQYLSEKELEATLYKEIRLSEEKISQYETERHNSSSQVFQRTLHELKMEAGMEEISGPGIVLSISPAYEYITPGQNDVYISPDVLRKLINELNMYGAKAISIADQRIVTTTTIRDIQGETRVDGYPLRLFPLEIKVIAKDAVTAKKLYSRMQISTIPDDFFIDNLDMSISEPQEKIVIPAYSNNFTISKMKTVKEEGKK